MALNFLYNNEEERPGKAFRVASKIIGGLILALFVFFIVRIILSGDSAEAKALLVIPSTKETIAARGTDFEIYKLPLWDIITKDGLYMDSNADYLKTTGELQATVRFKEADFKQKGELYGNASQPFKFMFIDTSDPKNPVYYTSDAVKISHKTGYYYARISFSGIKLDDKYNVKVAAAKAEAVAAGEEQSGPDYGITPDGIIAARLAVYPNKQDAQQELGGFELIGTRSVFQKAKINDFKKVYIE